MACDRVLVMVLLDFGIDKSLAFVGFWVLCVIDDANVHQKFWQVT